MELLLMLDVSVDLVENDLSDALSLVQFLNFATGPIHKIILKINHF